MLFRTLFDMEMSKTFSCPLQFWLSQLKEKQSNKDPLDPRNIICYIITAFIQFCISKNQHPLEQHSQDSTEPNANHML